MSRFTRLVLTMLTTLGVLAAGLQVYALGLARFPVPALTVARDTRELVLIFHGSGGRNEPTVMALEEQLGRGIRAGSGRSVQRYVWSPYSDDRLRAYANGTRVGNRLGEQLAALPNLRSLHLIAHSAGAYILEPLCRAYRARTLTRIRIRMTYLDPIGLRGPLEPGWGLSTTGVVRMMRRLLSIRTIPRRPQPPC